MLYNLPKQSAAQFLEAPRIGCAQSAAGAHFLEINADDADSVGQAPPVEAFGGIAGHQVYGNGASPVCSLGEQRICHGVAPVGGESAAVGCEPGGEIEAVRLDDVARS